MDIRALRYFVELVREKSFTRASEKLFVTQPTISKMIRNMEEELGQPLLNREGHSFTLTDSGQVLFARGQLILAQMQQLEAELADLQSLQHGRLALGIPGGRVEGRGGQKHEVRIAAWLQVGRRRAPQATRTRRRGFERSGHNLMLLFGDPEPAPDLLHTGGGG